MDTEDRVGAMSELEGGRAAWVAPGCREGAHGAGAESTSVSPRSVSEPPGPSRRHGLRSTRVPTLKAGRREVSRPVLKRASFAKGGASGDRQFVAKIRLALTALEDEGGRDIARWADDGRGFVVLKPKVFASKVMPLYWLTRTWASFVRLASLWKFRRAKGPDGSFRFSHDVFRRDAPEMDQFVVNPRINMIGDAASSTTFARPRPQAPPAPVERMVTRERKAPAPRRATDYTQRPRAAEKEARPEEDIVTPFDTKSYDHALMNDGGSTPTPAPRAFERPTSFHRVADANLVRKNGATSTTTQAAPTPAAPDDAGPAVPVYDLGTVDDAALAPVPLRRELSALSTVSGISNVDIEHVFDDQLQGAGLAPDAPPTPCPTADQIADSVPSLVVPGDEAMNDGAPEWTASSWSEGGDRYSVGATGGAGSSVDDDDMGEGDWGDLLLLEPPSTTMAGL